MNIKLLTKHNLEHLRLKGGCRGSSESTLDKIDTLLEITCHGSYIHCKGVSIDAFKYDVEVIETVHVFLVHIAYGAQRLSCITLDLL